MGLFDSNEANERSATKKLVEVGIDEFVQQGKALRFNVNIPSSKNSKEIIQIPTKYSDCCGAPVLGKGKESSCSKCGHKKDEKCLTCGKDWFKRRTIASLMFNKPTKKFIDLTRKSWYDNKMVWLAMTEDLTFPIFVGLYFYRDSRRGWDFNNISQIIADQMKHHGWIPDDDTRYFIPVYMGETLNKNEPGCAIVPLPNGYYNSFPELMRKMS